MKKVNDYKSYAVEGQETDGAMYFLIDEVGCEWEDAPSEEQNEKMLSILNAEFEPEEGESLCWGAEGKVFEVENGVWVAA